MLLGIQICIAFLVVCVSCAVIVLALIHRVLLKMLIDVQTIRLNLDAQAESREQRSRYGGY